MEEALANLEDALESWLSAAVESGLEIPQPQGEVEPEEYSGRFSVRVPKSLHRRLASRADAEACSLNQLVATILAEAVEGAVQKSAATTTDAYEDITADAVGGGADSMAHSRESRLSSAAAATPILHASSTASQQNESPVDLAGRRKQRRSSGRQAHSLGANARCGSLRRRGDRAFDATTRASGRGYRWASYSTTKDGTKKQSSISTQWRTLTTTHACSSVGPVFSSV